MTVRPTQDHSVDSIRSWSTAMNLLSVELARVRQQELVGQAELERQAHAMHRVVRARRAQRKAEEAAHRARLALASA